MKYLMHGVIDVEQQGQIIVGHVVGPWNVELIEYYREQMLKLIPKVMANGPWATIVELKGAAICPQEAIDLIKQGITADAVKHRVCTCYVITPDVEGYHLMNRVWRKLYEGIVPFEIFASMEEAIAWTEQQIAAANQ